VIVVLRYIFQVIDFGYGQITLTETLKNFVYNDPVAVEGTVSDNKGFRRLSTEEKSGKHSKVYLPICQNLTYIPY
jgi:hypothetical protein